MTAVQKEFNFKRCEQLYLLRSIRFEGRSRISTKAVLKAIDEFGPECFASQDTIAEAAGVSIRTCKRAIASLVEMSLVTREKRLNRFGVVTNHYRIVWSEISCRVSLQASNPTRSRVGPAKIEHGASKRTSVGSVESSVGPVEIEHGASMTPKPENSKDPPPTVSELDGGGEFEDLERQLRSIGVGKSREALQAAFQAGRTKPDVQRLLCHFQASQRDRTPPGPGLLYSWLVGRAPWPSLPTTMKSAKASQSEARDRHRFNISREWRLIGKWPVGDDEMKSEIDRRMQADFASVAGHRVADDSKAATA